MNKYTIDYGWNFAKFYTEFDGDSVIREFYKCANACFGIRKSITKEPVVTKKEQSDLPKEYQGMGVTHLLVHNFPASDEIAFDANYTEDDFRYWKVVNEWGDTCNCNRGIYSASCEVHKFYLEKAEAQG